MPSSTNTDAPIADAALAPRVDPHLLTSFEEITSRFADLNPWDRVFRTACGRIVKIKHVEIPVEAGHFAIRVSGALCDEKTGKALIYAGAPLVLMTHDAGVQFDGLVDLDSVLTAALQVVIDRAARAGAAHDARKALQGVLLAEHAVDSDIRARLIKSPLRHALRAV